MKNIELIKSNVQSWVEALTDGTRRNRLLFLDRKPDSTSILELGSIQDDLFAKLLKGNQISVSALNPATEPIRLRYEKTMANIIRKARENAEERGLQTLYVGAVMVEFNAENSEGRDYCAPLFLLPMHYERQQGRRGNYTVRHEGGIMLNETLFITLKKERNLKLESISTHFDALLNSEQLFVDIIQQIKSGFINKCSMLPGLQLRDDFLLSNFSFQKMKMVVELIENQETRIPRHKVISALCGDAEVRMRVQPKLPLFSPKEIDSVPPEDDFTFLPADSSQFVTIRQVINGWNGVIQGPPGTGKSQTIANLIGELVARKKNVLFVAQKSAALEVVQARLKQAGLGDIVLNLHGGEMKPAELKSLLEKAKQLKKEHAPEIEPIHRPWRDKMETLKRHRTLFHTPLDDWKVNTYQCYEELLAFKGREMERYHVGSGALQTIQPQDLEYTIELLTEHSISQAKVPSDSPWRSLKNWNDSTLNDFDVATRNYSASNQTFRKLCETVYSDLQWTQPETLDQLRQDCALITGFIDIHPRISSLIWKEDLSDIIRQLQKTILSKGKHQLLALLSPGYKKALKKLRAYATSEPLLRQEALTILEEVQRLKKIRDTKSLTPEKGNGTTREILQQYIHAIESLRPFLEVSNQTNLRHLESDMRVLKQTQSTGIDMHNLMEIREKLSELGLLDWADETLGIAPHRIPELFRYNYFSDLLDKHKLRAPKILNFAGQEFEKQRNKFVELDIKKQQIAVKRILASYADSVLDSENQFQKEYDFLKSQMAKRRPVSFRKLFDNAEHLMLSIFPVWMTSPLSVTQLTKAKTLFDVVIFDEASQVKPEDAICAILRGKQIVVAGDTRQLPPTPFFENESYDTFTEVSESSNNNETEVTTAGFESLMDMVIGNLPGLGNNNDGWFLEWHYRSKDEALIAFSNSHIYENRMITFPGPKAQYGIGFIHADARRMGISTDAARYEAQRVIDEVFRIVRTNPEASIGVIAFGLKQTNLIETEFEQALQNQPEDVRNYFSQPAREAFFIKNLESVQGDERDFIVLSIGKQRNENGVIPLNFGPITQRGGERRLNVAITRARHGMTVVASFDPEEIEPARTQNNKGNNLLRRYLLFAKLQGRQLSQEMAQNNPVSRFDEDIRKRLESKGLKISSNYGASRYRLDLAVHHPQDDDRFVMAIECDGSAFNDIPCIRDRDRLREEHLKNMGWNVVHVWYADWYSDPEAETKRIFDLYSKYLNEPEPRPQPVEVKPVEPIAQPAPIVNTRVPAVLNFPQKENIREYTDEELIKLIKWVQSDGVRRNHKEIFEEAFKELPFTNRGSLIKQRILNVIREVYP